jgi:hypothetical protein
MDISEADVWHQALGGHRAPSIAYEWLRSDDAKAELVWSKGCSIPGLDARLFRRDRYGREIWRSKYGQTTLFGWEIDHLIPTARGGSDSIKNLPSALEIKSRKI